jgi:hypothetical protein
MHTTDAAWDGGLDEAASMQPGNGTAGSPRACLHAVLRAFLMGRLQEAEAFDLVRAQEAVLSDTGEHLMVTRSERSRQTATLGSTDPSSAIDRLAARLHGGEGRRERRLFRRPCWRGSAADRRGCTSDARGGWSTGWTLLSFAGWLICGHGMGHGVPPFW